MFKQALTMRRDTEGTLARQAKDEIDKLHR